MQADWPIALQKGWHPVAFASELGSNPLAVRLMDRPLVLFRNGQQVAALEDRCPHRNAPLSSGSVLNGEIACPYHGWRFGLNGRCTHVPGSSDAVSAAVPVIAAREVGSLIWASFAEHLQELPDLPTQIADPAFDSFWWPLPTSRAAIGDAIDNLLDPIHAYFLHPGLVRKAGGPPCVEIDFAVDQSGATAIYTEPREGMTWLQRLTEGKRTVSWGRYKSPTCVQIGFEDAMGIQATISVAFSPVGMRETRPYACFSTRKGRLPAWFKRWIIIAFHRHVLDQDLAMLKLQTDQIERFGGPTYQTGPLDFFGPVIWSALNGKALQPDRRHLRLYGQT